MQKKKKKEKKRVDSIKKNDAISLISGYIDK